PGIVHDVSATSQTFYIEPSKIVPLNNKLREIKSKIHAEIVRILTDLTRNIRTHIAELKENEKIIAQIDFHFAKARYAVKLHATEPEIVKTKSLEIDGMKHPLLIDYVEEVVANDFKIGDNYKAVLITGSNTGGKTVTIKTVGLFILMTKAGLFLPCQNAKIYPFKKVLADIGDEQSIAQSLSTFSSHMKNIIDIVNNSDEETFAIIDEICAGTDPQEGAVLAQVILERLAQKNVTSCITTHYGELKSLEYTNPYFKNACVEFNVETLKPTYKLTIGIPGLSNAIAISSTIGLDKTLVDRAKEILVSQKDPSITVVEKLQEKQHELEASLEIAEKSKEEALTIQKDLETRLDKLKKEKKKVVKGAKDKLDDDLSRAKGEIKDILYEMRHEKSEKIARRSYSRLAKLEKHVRGEIGKYDEVQQYEPINWEEMKEGSKVMLKEIHQPVTILTLPDKNGKVFVQMGLIKTKIEKNKLAYYEEKYEHKKPINYNKRDNFELQRIDMSNTLDLRGFRVEDALDSLERYLDRASLVNLSPVYVIHGHGTGALKSAVRDFLESSPYVAKFRPGEPSEGSDGVSVIDIN
ncbi:Smr/MutS family protein, partial [bacterium]|nr:Smr/MutS family protein [bacterium]